MPSVEPSAASSLPQWIGDRAQRHPDRVATTFVDDDGNETSWSYQDVWIRACQFASRLREIQSPSVDKDSPRALLLFPPGLEFITGLLGSQIAGWTPVPTCYPKPGRTMERLDSAAIDCLASAIVGDQSTLSLVDRAKLHVAARELPFIATDLNPRPLMTTGGEGYDGFDPHALSLTSESMAFLQYTSGSTTDPKGVMVRQRNLMANLESIRRGFKIDWQDDTNGDPVIGVFWLPFFHDMGLIGGLLAPLYVGGRTILISPRAFLQRPVRWLKMISDHRAVVSGAPNFAYQLCIDRIAPEQTDEIDLSSWKTAFCGAEPVLARTLIDFAHRFSSNKFSFSSFYPCYGLAEATLLAAGGDGPSEPKFFTVSREMLDGGRVEESPDGRGKAFLRIVSCGKAAYQTELLIVDPETKQVCEDRNIGEVWIRGTSVSEGYWNRGSENEERFNVSTADERTGFCRTGDLGFMDQGELYVTGRLKDVVILRGRNLFPQDIESTVHDCLGSDSGRCAAFSVEGPRGEGLAIVAEVSRAMNDSELPEKARAIRRVVIDIHEVDPRNVLLVRPATVPVTSSGKVQRHRCRELFHSDDIRCRYRYDRAFLSEQAPISIPEIPTNLALADRGALCAMIERWLAEWLIVRAGVEPRDIDRDKPFSDYGLDSMTAVELSGETEDWSGIELTPVVAWNHPTIADLSHFIADELIRTGTDRQHPSSSSI